MKEIFVLICFLFMFGVTTHTVLKILVARQFLQMELYSLETKNEVLKAQTKIAELESEIKDLKTIFIMKIEQEEIKR